MYINIYNKMSKHYFSILLILIIINNAKAIDYASYRVNDTVSINVTHGTVRTTTDILEKLNNTKISSPESLQVGTEHILQFGALLRIKILDIFGKLIYDYYDEFSINEMYALYKIYQDTLERKYNIFDIVPNALINGDLTPLAICNYINLHVQTCLQEISSMCTHTKFPLLEYESNDTNIIELTKSIYYSAHLGRKYNDGISIFAVLKLLKSNHLKFTAELFSGLLHNIPYDDYDYGVRTAEQELIHYFLFSMQNDTDSKYELHRILLDSLDIQHYHSISKLLKDFLQSNRFPNHINHYAQYLAKHIHRDLNVIDENIELLGAAFEDGDINLKYLFELVLPNDTIDTDVIEAKNYFLQQIMEQNILEKYLRVEKYQQKYPNQLLIGILGQLRDIGFISDIAISLQQHARFWHSSHMIENLNQLLELFDAYENLRGIPEYSKLIVTIDKLRNKLMDSNNTTIEISCTNPRNCLRIALKIISQCTGIDRPTKIMIYKFLDRSSFQCVEKYYLKYSKLRRLHHEGVSKKPVITTTRKNLGHISQKPEKSLKISTTTSANVNQSIEISTTPVVFQVNPNCRDGICSDDDEILPTGGIEIQSTSISNDLKITTEIINTQDSSQDITSTNSPILEFTTILLDDELLSNNTTVNPLENTTIKDCDDLKCQKNDHETTEFLSTTTEKTDLDIDDNNTLVTRANYSDIEATSSLLLSSITIPTIIPEIDSNILLTTLQPVVRRPKPMCHHHDPHYRRKLRRLEKLERSNMKKMHHVMKNIQPNHVDNSKVTKVSYESKTTSILDKNANMNMNMNANTMNSIKTQEYMNTNENLQVNHNLQKKNSNNVNLIETQDESQIESSESRKRQLGTAQNTIGNSSKIQIGQHNTSQTAAEVSPAMHHHKFSPDYHHHSSSQHTSKNLNRKIRQENVIRNNTFGTVIPVYNESSNSKANITDESLSSTGKIIRSSINSKNDRNIKNRLFDFNVPLFSNHDLAMNDKPSANRKNSRSKRQATNKNNTNESSNDYVKNRLLDINIPFFSNYDFDAKETPNVAKKNNRSKREIHAVSDTNIKTRILDFNIPIGSNQNLKFNDEELQKKNDRSRRKAASAITTSIPSTTSSSFDHNQQHANMNINNKSPRDSNKINNKNDTCLMKY